MGTTFEGLYTPDASPEALTESLRNRAESAVKSMDARGAWLTDGRLRRAGNGAQGKIIETRVFSDNVRVLARFIAATRE